MYRYNPKDYAEDSIPVLSKDKHILGVITSDDIVEMVDNEMGEDYAKLAGLTAEEDLKETTLQSMKKRMPWLIILLFLGMIVSSVVGIFENVVAALPIVICFQSLVLDMAGNVGTQSLAVTIRVLMDENLSGKQKLLLVVKRGKNRPCKWWLAWNNGTCISGNICASVQGLHMAWSICGIRLCRSFTACGNGNFKPCGHSDSDVFPQDKD